MGLGLRMFRPFRAPDFGGETWGFVRASLRPRLWGPVLSGLWTGASKPGVDPSFSIDPQAGGQNAGGVIGTRGARMAAGVYFFSRYSRGPTPIQRLKAREKTVPSM